MRFSPLALPPALPTVRQGLHRAKFRFDQFDYARLLSVMFEISYGPYLYALSIVVFPHFFTHSTFEKPPLSNASVSCSLVSGAS